jgi:opacity protein-like surface antigen
MKSIKLCVLALAVAALAGAQSAEFSFSGGQSRLSNADIGSGSTTGKSDDYELRNGFRLGFRMTLNNWRFFGHEVGYAYNRTQFRVNDATSYTEYGTAIHQGFYNFLVYGTPEGTKVRPFLAGGGHFSNYVYPGYSVTSGGGSTKFGFNYGGGVKFKVSELFLIRFDVRQYQTGKPFDFPLQSGLMRQTEVSMGFGIGI